MPEILRQYAGSGAGIKGTRDRAQPYDDRLGGGIFEAKAALLTIRFFELCITSWVVSRLLHHSIFSDFVHIHRWDNINTQTVEILSQKDL